VRSTSRERLPAAPLRRRMRSRATAARRAARGAAPGSSLRCRWRWRWRRRQRRGCMCDLGAAAGAWQRPEHPTPRRCSLRPRRCLAGWPQSAAARDPAATIAGAAPPPHPGRARDVAARSRPAPPPGCSPRQVHAAGEGVHIGALHAHIVNADLGVGHTAAVPALGVWLALRLPVAARRACVAARGRMRGARPRVSQRLPSPR
jgi:hypothetical protein